MGRTRPRLLDIALFERACAAHPFGRTKLRPGSRHEARNKALDDLFCAAAGWRLLKGLGSPICGDWAITAVLNGASGSSSLRRCLKVLGSPILGDWAIAAVIDGASGSHFEHPSGGFRRQTSGIMSWGLHVVGNDLGSRLPAHVVNAEFPSGTASLHAERGATLPCLGKSVRLSPMPPDRT